ncbi:MAG TPA: electron-transfer flavoprotein:ubiquinone oxidoreductase, partial [Solirubrobacterales bacterium]|nr:electron-transfer flavoprotein:ubiquinone oxidoreductase [Solirubrobacterales bacterium]
ITDPEEERIEVGVAIVGGGPAGLACAIKVMQLLEDEPELTEKLGEVPVAVVEKGKTPGAHLLSGANMKPSAMRELFPDLDPSDWPVYQEVTKDAVYLLTKKMALPLVPMPPNFRNHGNYVTSVAKLGRFLAEKAEEAGVYILSETSADKLLVEDRIVRGVRSGDKGRGKDGEELSNFEPGSDVVAKATVLAEGTLGHLTGAALDYFDLRGPNPQRWEIGVKEVWEVEKPLDRVIHTMGWPLRKRAKWNEFGGSFIYPMGEDKVALGLVVGLDTTDATFSCHDALQELKTHPFVKKILEGGKRVGWGAKTIPSGGYWSMPKRLSSPGVMITGDAAGMVNVPTLKGIHYAMHSGMYAAEAIVESLKEDSVNFENYERKVKKSLIEKDLYESRNMRQVFSKGFFLGGALASAMTVTKGAFPGGHWKAERDAEIPVEIDGASASYPKPDNKYLFDKLNSVFLSGNATRDDAPNHIRIQERVPREIAQTWVSMCPAQVYEIPEEELESGAETVDVHVTPSNCVQCGAITAKGGRLTLPEGGDGPLYTEV